MSTLFRGETGAGVRAVFDLGCKVLKLYGQSFIIFHVTKHIHTRIKQNLCHLLLCACILYRQAMSWCLIVSAVLRFLLNLAFIKPSIVYQLINYKLKVNTAV